MTLTPTRNLLLLRQMPAASADDRVGSLYVPQTDATLYRQWEISAVGPEVLDPALLPGLRVIVAPRAGQLVDLGSPMLMIAEDDVVAWVA